MANTQLTKKNADLGISLAQRPGDLGSAGSIPHCCSARRRTGGQYHPASRLGPGKRRRALAGRWGRGVGFARGFCGDEFSGLAVGEEEDET